MSPSTQVPTISCSASSAARAHAFMAWLQNAGDGGKIRASWNPAIRRHVGARAATRRRAAGVAVLCTSAIVLLLVTFWISQLQSVLRVPQIPRQTHQRGRVGTSRESLHHFHFQNRAERQRLAEVADVLDTEPGAAE